MGKRTQDKLQKQNKNARKPENNPAKESGGYTTRELMARFLPYFAPYKGILAKDLACAALTAACGLSLPMIMRYITDVGLGDAASLRLGTIAALSGLYLVLRLVEAAATYYMSNMGHVMGAYIETDMRRAAYGHLQKLSDSYYNHTKIGQIMGRITNDLFDVTEFAHHCPEEFFLGGLKVAVAMIVLMGVHPGLTLLLFAMLPPVFFIYRIQNGRMRQAFSRQRNQVGELNARLEDSLLGQRVVKAFANENLEIAKFEEGNQAFLETKKLSYRYMAAFFTTSRLVDGLLYLTVLGAGGVFLVWGQISPGDLVAYLLYVTEMITTLRRLMEFTEQFQRGITGIERFVEIMDADIDIFDAPDARDLQDVQGNIAFEQVSFTYKGRQEGDGEAEVFSNLDLTIGAGERVAIVGPSGGGKTTLCNLIPRFYDVDSGRVCLDGRDVREYRLKSLRDHIGVVGQEVYLFSGTVEENIAYGRPGAGREEVIEAAKAAGAHDFIMELPQGYDSYVGERGVRLSGGQRQRISIARVFLKNPSILILDEATSALDNESEYYVGLALAGLSRGRTTLTIAHRLSTIQNSDRIVVLGKEGILEQGSHSQLMAWGGHYAALQERAALGT